MLRSDRFIAGAALAALLASTTAALAAADRQWQTSIQYWEGGDVDALLIFGTPDSDDVVISAECSSEDPGRIVVDLLLDLGPNVPGAQSTAHFLLEDVQHSYRATIHDSELVPFGRIELAIDDPLWDALLAGEAGEVALFYAEPTAFNSNGTDPAVGDFLAECIAIDLENPR